MNDDVDQGSYATWLFGTDIFSAKLCCQPLVESALEYIMSQIQIEFFLSKYRC